MYKTLVFNLIKYNADMAGCNMYKVFEDGQRYPKNEISFANAGVEIYYGVDVLKTFYKLFSVCNKIFKRSLFTDTFFPEGKIYEDARVMYLLAGKSNIATFNSYNGYNYLQRSSGITGSLKKSNYIDKVIVWDEIYEYIKSLLPNELPYIISRKNKLILNLIDDLIKNSDSKNILDLITKLSDLIIYQ